MPLKTFNELNEFARDVMLAPERFGETVVHWPEGDPTRKVELENINVDWQMEEGQSYGPQGLASHTRGTSTDRWLHIDVPIDVTVTHRDKFVVINPTTEARETVNVVRKAGQDAAVQTWLCCAPEGRTSKTTRIRE